MPVCNGLANLLEDHQRTNANFGMARRLCISMGMMHTGEAYVPPEL